MRPSPLAACVRQGARCASSPSRPSAPSWAPVAPLPAWALPAAHGRHGARARAALNLSVEFGLDENEAAQLELWSNIVSAIGMVLGGWLSDKLGRRGTLFVYFALMSLPTAWLAWKLQQLGYVMPRPAGARQPSSRCCFGSPASSTTSSMASCMAPVPPS